MLIEAVTAIPFLDNSPATCCAILASPDKPMEAAVRVHSVLVTREMAAAWLSRNFSRNRTIQNSRVARWKREMRDGLWRLSHQGIAFDRDGWLVDGQHRLTALLQCPEGTTVVMLVFQYLKRDTAIRKFDLNARRSNGDVLAIDGLCEAKVSALYAAIATSIFQGIAGSSTSLQSEGTSRITAEFKNDIDWACKSGAKRYAPHLAALAYAYPCAPEAVAKFVRMVWNAEGLVAGSPAHTAHAYISKRRGDVFGSGTRVDRNDQFHCIINALMHHCIGTRSHKCLKGWNGDSMPQSTVYFMEKRKALGLPTGERA